MKVRDLSSSTAVTASPDEGAGSAWERMHALRTDHLVVMRDGRVVGVVSRHDLGGPAGGAHRRSGRRIGDLMNSDVVPISPAATLQRAAMLMRKHGIGCLPIVDRDRLVGIVTVGQLMEVLERELDV
jgi:CBS domain-containing protein